MRATKYGSFSEVLSWTRHHLHKDSIIVHPDRWQGMDISSKPEMATQEVQHVSFSVPLRSESLQPYREDIMPNLPWADYHFKERVCGYPINPGVEWANWPGGKSAARFLDGDGKFNHNYMERYWPKLAGKPREASLTADDWEAKFMDEQQAWPDMILPHSGIKYLYGDLADVIKLMADDPYTRQAYLPIWFPEDTGGGAKRAPCTLGYHFMMRQHKLDIVYYIRSCDYVRHFRDDMYLTVRLLLWVLDELRKVDEEWHKVTPGSFHMHISSLHVFRNDYMSLFPRND
jgi:hypothetical protein